MACTLTVYDAIAESNSELQGPCIAGLIQGFSEGKAEGTLDKKGTAGLVKLLNEAEPQIRAQAVKLASLLLPASAPELQMVFNEATTTALDDSADLQDRENAIAILARARTGRTQNSIRHPAFCSMVSG